jgi:hypothetical protein
VDKPTSLLTTDSNDALMGSEDSLHGHQEGSASRALDIYPDQLHAADLRGHKKVMAITMRISTIRVSTILILIELDVLIKDYILMLISLASISKTFCFPSPARGGS